MGGPQIQVLEGQLPHRGRTPEGVAEQVSHAFPVTISRKKKLRQAR